MKASFLGAALAARLVSAQYYDNVVTTSTTTTTAAGTPTLTLTVQPVTTSQPVTTAIVSPILASTSSTSALGNGVVTVTSYRTVTDYCGCGIPGVSTIGPILVSTTSSSTAMTTSGGVVVSPTLISTTSSSTTTTSGGVVVSPTLINSSSTVFTVSSSTIILPPPTVTNTMTTTTTTASTSASTSASTTASMSTSVSTSAATTSASTTASSTTSTAAPIVTDQAYINTVLRHHNIHRTNGSAAALVWSPSLAATAQKIAASCNYNHNVAVDGGGYGQNIGAGYLSTQMGSFITLGLYNSEVNSYTYYGGEPDTSTVGQWGHYTQIVWKSTTSIGCYTQDCSATGLSNTGPGVAPFFTVCNYSPAGNVVGAFNANVGRPIGLATIGAGYNCPTDANCE